MSNRRRTVPLPLLVLMLVLVLALGAVPISIVHAATITVTSTADVIADDGQCTLREAITAANSDAASGTTPGECTAGSGADTITLPAGTYTLSIASTGEDANANGDLDITDPDGLIIQGNGQSNTIIDGDDLDRIFEIVSGSGNVTLEDLTVQNGTANSSDDGGQGGGIFHGETTNTLTLTRVTVTSNTSPKSGGGILTNGPLVISHSTISNNQCAQSGGGIFVRHNSSTASLTMSHCTVDGNTAATAPGFDLGGGGIFGGGQNAAFDISHSTISNNSVADTGTTSGGNDRHAGGLWLRGPGGPFFLTQVTISGNSTPHHGGGILAQATLTLDHVTITGNTADSDNANDGEGGGIFVLSSVTYKNTIILDNHDEAASNSDDCAENAAMTSGDYNLVGNGTGCTSASQANDITESTPSNELNATLADNGGPTKTHALVVGGDAIDYIPDGVNGCRTTNNDDQRGVIRPQGTSCDIGAFELEQVALGTIVIEKETLPPGGTGFGFRDDIQAPNTFNLDDAGAKTFDNVAPGAYAVTETVPAGWDLTAIQCLDATGDSSGDTGTGEATIALATGETVTCTFTNTELASIEVVKVVVGDPPGTAWQFTGDAGTLNTAGGGGSDTAEDLAPGSYTITETTKVGYGAEVSCSSGETGSDSVSVDLSAGEVVTCTFTNTQLASLEVVKVVEGDPPGSDWQFTGDLGAFSITASGGNHGPVGVQAGQYTVSETVKAGYEVAASCSSGETGSDSVSVDLSTGDDVTCTFTNTKLHTLEIRKDGTGTGTVTSVPAGIDCGGDCDKAYTHGVTVTLTATPGGDSVFVGWSGDADCAGGNVTMDADKICTATFDLQQGTVVVEKQTEPDGDPALFTFVGVINDTLSDGQQSSLLVTAGIYTVTEVAGAGWELTGVSCSDGDSSGDTGTATATFDVAAGETVTCTFTNRTGPYFTSTPLTTADEDALYSYDVTASHTQPGTPVTLTAPYAGLPGWLLFEDLGGGAGTLSGTPNQSTVGDSGVTLVVGDDGGLTATQSFSITVSNVNDPPRFESVSNKDLTSNVGYTYAITSTDEDGDALTLTAPTLPAWLTFTDEGNGGGRLEGAPGFAEIGEHPVLLQLQDPWGGSAQQSFTLLVANEPPFPLKDTYTAVEDSVDNVFEVLANDIDNPDDLSLTDVGAASHGTATQSGDTILYTPAAGYFGPDYIRYTVSDGLESSDAMVFVTVEGVNDQPPQPQDDPITVYEDAGVHQIWVLNNDTEPEGDPLSITAVGVAAHGGVSIQYPVTGTLLYTPTENYHGPDIFTYTVGDGLFEATATVSITVNPLNDPPVAAPDTFDVAEDSSDNPLPVLANDTDVDGDELTLTGIEQPQHGVASFQPDPDEGGLAAQAKGSLAAQAISAFTVITYTPNLNFVGTDTFKYTVSDGMVEVQSTVTVTVQAGPNDAPEAQNDFFTVAGDAVDATLNVLGNDSDAEDDALSVSLVTPPANAAAAAAPDGLSILYTPNPGFSDYDNLVYELSDGSLTMTATARIRVLPVNNAPTAVDDAFTVDAGTSANALVVLANDTDPDDDILLVSAVGAPAQAGASVQLNPLHTGLLYTPGAGSSDTFTYTVSDGAATATATVAVSINADTTTAGLSLNRGVEPTTLAAGEPQAVTALYTITNAGPALATGLVMSDTWSEAPTAVHVLAGGACTGTDPIRCSLADLPAGESVQLRLGLSFSPEAALTATAAVSTDKTDPNPGNDAAPAAIAVGGPRETRSVGLLSITAGSFVDLGGGLTRAQGDVGIGPHFYVAGAGATLDFDAGGIVAASGELRLRVGEYALFAGSFTADGDTGLGAPDAGVDYSVLSEVAGFSVAGGATVTQLDFGQGVAAGQAELAYAGGQASATIPLDFEVRAGPHFSGAASAGFAVLYGDGSVLSLGAESAALARTGNDYELLATGVVSYNLTHPFDDSQVYTPDMPGVYEAVPGAAFALGGDGGLRHLQGGAGGPDGADRLPAGGL